MGMNNCKNNIIYYIKALWQEACVASGERAGRNIGEMRVEKEVGTCHGKNLNFTLSNGNTDLYLFNLFP